MAWHKRSKPGAPYIQQGSRPRTRFGRHWGSSVGALLAYLTLAALMFATTWLAPGARWIGLDGDPDSTMWSIQWVAYAAVHDLNPFLTNYIFYPGGVTILWSNADAPVALSWAVLPITLWLGPIVAYNVLQTLALGLSAWTAFVAIRLLVIRQAAAFVGALVYGFGPYMLSQSYGHLGLSFVIVPPLVMWLLYRLLVRRDMPPVLIGAIAGILEAFQLLTSAELVVTELIVAVAALVWLAVLVRARRWHIQWRDLARRVAVSGAAAIVVFGVLAAYPLYTLLRGPGRVTQGPVRPFGTYVTDLMSLFVPNGLTQALHNDWTVRLSNAFPGGAPEAGGYLGIILLAVILFTVVRWFHEPVVVFAAGLFAFCVLISLGPNLVYGGHLFHSIHLPWRVLRDIPFLNDVLPERMAVYFDLFAGLLLAVFTDRAWRSPVRLSRPLAVLATAAALALMVPSWPWINTTAHVPAIFQPGTADNRFFSNQAPDGSVVVVLPADALAQGQGYAMLWQAYDGDAFKMPEGDLLHGGPDGKPTIDPPPGPLWNAMSDLQAGTPPPSSDADLASVRAQLTDYGVRAIVVGRMAHEAEAVDYFTQLMGSPPTDMDDVHMWTVNR